MSRPASQRCWALLLLATLLLLGVAPSALAEPSGPEPVRPEQGVWFGPDLDWAADAPEGYQQRLGLTPSLYALRLGYPLETEDLTQWRQAGRDAAAQGAVLVVNLEPRLGLAPLGPADASTANDLLEELHGQYGTHQLVRFGAEMNGSWEPWGQQPLAYTTAFQTVATAVHAGTSGAEMVWAPSYGAGYPFARADGRLSDLAAVEVAELDTDGDGEVTEADDPYGPYFPGEQHVDRVGLSAYYFGKGQQDAAAGLDVPLQANRAPGPGELAGRLAEQWGYTTPQPTSFYDRFSPDHPVLLETGALYVDDLGGDDERAVKEAWWEQLLTELAEHPRIDAVTWLEVEREEAEAAGELADWRVSQQPGLAAAFSQALQGSGLVEPGPVTEPVTARDGSSATAQTRTDLTGGTDQMGWIVACAGVLAVAFLTAGVVGRLAPGWRYPEAATPNRDLRIDLFRGFVIIAVVVIHVEVAGPYSYVTLKAIGAITGAEMFVFLSGTVLGMVYTAGARKFGERRVALASLLRARQQYLLTLAVIVLVFVLGLLPFLDGGSVTTFTDRGTGSGGEGEAGRVYDLYPNVDRLLDYPPPWYALRQLLLLEMGPWPFNIMGLFVVLSLLVPPLMWLIRRRLWWLVLAVSWGLYVLQRLQPELQPVPSQFDAVFPLLIWQVLFTHGLVLGHHRRQVVAALTTRSGKLLVGVAVVVYAGLLAYLWAGHAYGFTPAPFPADLYGTLYQSGYQRIDLQWGRLLDVALVAVVVFAVLTTCWKPLARASGWLWIPLGQASLYVFVVQVFLVLFVASIPGLDPTSWWQGTLVHTACIALLLVMVRRRFLFRVIPH